MKLRGALLGATLIGLCASSAFTSGCASKACSLIGCTDSEELTFSADVATVTDTLVTACRNGSCWQGSIGSSDLTPSDSSHVIQLTAKDAEVGSVTCSIDVRAGSATAALTFDWRLDTVGAAAKGDVLSVQFATTDGTLRLSESGTLTAFASSYPNGKDCDEVACLSGTAKGTAE